MNLVSKQTCLLHTGKNRSTLNRWIQAGLVRLTPEGFVDLDQVQKVCRQQNRSRGSRVTRTEQAEGLDLETFTAPFTGEEGLARFEAVGARIAAGHDAARFRKALARLYTLAA